MTVRERGEVVWYPALFAEYDRPFLVVSTDAHPFHGEEWIGLAVTTTGSDAAIPIDEDDWELGGLPRPSYVKPWNPAVLKEADVLSTAGAVTRRLTDRSAEELASFCGRPPGVNRRRPPRAAAFWPLAGYRAT